MIDELATGNRHIFKCNQPQTGYHNVDKENVPEDIPLSSSDSECLEHLTGCETAGIPTDPYEEILISMILEFPKLHSFSELHWEMEENGRCRISAENVNRILNYRDSKLPRYRFEIEMYRREMDIINGSISM